MSEHRYAVLFLDMSNGDVSKRLDLMFHPSARVVSRVASREAAQAAAVATAKQVAVLVGSGGSFAPASNGARAFFGDTVLASWFVLDTESDGFHLRFADGRTQGSFPTFDAATVEARRIAEKAIATDTNGTIEMSGGMVVAVSGGKPVLAIAIEPLSMSAEKEAASVLSGADATNHVNHMLADLQAVVESVSSQVQALQSQSIDGDEQLAKVAMAATAVGAATERLQAAGQLLRAVGVS